MSAASAATPDRFTHRAVGPAATAALGRSLGRVATPGLVVALSGPLGAGKTAFVRGVAEGLGTPDLRAVTSPTFVLEQHYPGRLPIVHYDVYRLAGIDEFLELGAEETMAAAGVVLVEWADRVAHVLPADRIDVAIAHDGPDARVFGCRRRGPHPPPAFDRWRAENGP